MAPETARAPLAIAVSLALVAFLASFLAIPSARAAPTGHGHHRHARIGVADARQVGGPHRCAPPLARRRDGLARLRVCATRMVGRRVKARTRRAPAAPISPSSLYWGAWIGEQFTGAQAPWDMNAVAKFEQITEKSLSLVNFSAPFADCAKPACEFLKFPLEAMENVRSHGAIPFFSWASDSTPTNLEEPEFQLADVIAGSFDSYIREFATAAREWGHPFFLRFNWEMNGNWFPWAEGVNGNNPGEYVAAWRHVHDIFTAVGATNATWTWCPNVDPAGNLRDLASLYPGDAFVDWTCLDGYNWGTSPLRHDRWRTFDQLFRSTYEKITEEVAPTKPMAIGEVGSTEDGGSKAEWIAEMLREVPTEYPRVHGLQWFEKNEDGAWPIESSTGSAAAFAAGIRDSAYLGNEFGSAGTGPVAPPPS